MESRRGDVEGYDRQAGGGEAYLFALPTCILEVLCHVTRHTHTLACLLLLSLKVLVARRHSSSGSLDYRQPKPGGGKDDNRNARQQSRCEGTDLDGRGD